MTWGWTILSQESDTIVRLGFREVPNSGPPGGRIREYVLERISVSGARVEKFSLSESEYSALRA